MGDILRAGVIGAGVFGGYHAGKYASLPGVVLAGVHDRHPPHARTLADRHGALAFADAAELIAAVDLVSIAAPAIAHAGLALAALRAGKPVYVEKPLSTRLEDAERMVAEADRRGLVIACGFLERAGFAAMGLFDVPEPLLRLEAVRLGSPSPRNLDVSVVLDLMIHDLDLALALSPAEPQAVEATGAALANEFLDVVEAHAAFDDGLLCRFRASRVAEARERTMRLVYPSGEVTVDFLTRRFENTTPFPLDPDFQDTPAGRDPLGTSIGAFVAAVRGEAARPLASAGDGVRALDLALAVEKSV